MKILSAAAIGAAALWMNLVVAGEEKTPPNAIKMEFKDAALDTVLEQLSDSAGLTIVKDATIDGRITIISKQPMNVNEALELLNSVLKEKGFIGIRTEKILKIKRLEDAKKLNVPVINGADPDKVRDSDNIITQVVPIKYLDAVQLKRDFAPLMPSYADLSANAASNSLIITDTSSNIKRMLTIIKAMDTQTSTVAEVKIFPMKYADASSAARLINEIFAEQTRGGQGNQNQNPFGRFQNFFGGGGGGGGRFGGGGGGPGGGAGGGPGGTQNPSDDQAGHRPQRVTASADQRTNSVAVSAAPDTMKVIENILKDLDNNPTAEQAVFIYHLENSQSANLEGVLNALFGSGSVSRSSTRTTATSTQGRGTSVQRTQGGFGSSGGGGGNAFGGGGGGNAFGGGGGGNTFGGGGTGANAFGGGGNTFGGGGGRTGAGGAGGGGARTGGGANSGASDLSGQVFVVADYDTNSLIVMTPQKNFDRVKAVIKDLDRPVPQVEIKVLLAEVTHSKSTDAGSDFSVLTNGAVQAVTTNFGVGALNNGAIAKIVTGDVSAVLRAITTEGKLEVLSRPYIVCSNNQASNITVGQEVPFIVSSRTTDTGQTINTIQYQDIGIILNVTAHINDQGLVIMDVAPEVSSLTGQTVPIQAGVDAPVFAKRSAFSRVGVPDGQTIVIGGLMEDKKTDTNQGIPVLRNTPFLGKILFGTRKRDKAKTELLIFLTPHVAHSPGCLKPMADQEIDALQLVPGAIKQGTFDEHMRGMERGAVPREVFEPMIEKHDPDVNDPAVPKGAEGDRPIPNQPNQNRPPPNPNRPRQPPPDVNLPSPPPDKK